MMPFRNRYGIPHSVKSSKKSAETISFIQEKPRDEELIFNPSQDDSIDIYHESVSQRDPETSSLLSYAVPQVLSVQNYDLPARKLLPIISLLLFTITNVLPIMLSCGLKASAGCLKLRTVGIPSALQWAYVVRLIALISVAS